MIFGPAENSVHNLKRGDGTGIQSIDNEDLKSLAESKDLLLIGVEILVPSGTTVLMKFRISPKPFKALLLKLELKCKELAVPKKKWSTYKRAPSRMSHLGKSCDMAFMANYCIVSGVPSQYFNGGTIHDNIIDKLRKAVMGRATTSRACEDALADIKHKRRKALKLSNMGWKAINMERAFVLVKLDAPITVGMTMKGGTRRYERTLVTKPDKDNKGGEYF